MSFTNFRRRLCQPSLDVRGISASFSARRHQSRSKCLEHGFDESSGDGNSHPSPIDSRFRRDCSSTRTASPESGGLCSIPILSFSARQRIRFSLRSTSDQRITSRPAGTWRTSRVSPARNFTSWYGRSQCRRWPRSMGFQMSAWRRFVADCESLGRGAATSRERMPGRRLDRRDYRSRLESDRSVRSCRDRRRRCIQGSPTTRSFPMAHFS